MKIIKPRIVGIVALFLLALGGFGASLCQSGIARADTPAPAGDDPNLKTVSMIKDLPNTPDPAWKTGNPTAKGSDLHWLCDVKFCGPHVVVIGRNGWFCVFDIDPATAKLTFKSSGSGPYHNWDWYNLAVKEVAGHQWVVYCTHAASLDWFKLNNDTGALEWQEHLAIPKGAYPFMTPDKDRLILAGANAACATLDSQSGKPTMVSQSKCVGAGGTLSPDGKNYYASAGDEMYGYSVSPKDGSLTQICKITVPGLSSNKWAWIDVAPNGKHVYRPTAGEVAVIDRDPETGVLKYKTSQKIEGIACILEMTFNPDGRSGYYVCMGEGCVGAKSSNCTGSFTSDPESGALTYQGQAPLHGGYTRLELDPVHGDLISLIKLGPSTVCSFKTPVFPAAAK